jgi:hypothetical protein
MMTNGTKFMYIRSMYCYLNTYPGICDWWRLHFKLFHAILIYSYLPHKHLKLAVNCTGYFQDKVSIVLKYATLSLPCLYLSCVFHGKVTFSMCLLVYFSCSRDPYIILTNKAPSPPKYKRKATRPYLPFLSTVHLNVDMIASFFPPWFS